MLDTEQRNGKEIRSCRTVVSSKNVENITDRGYGNSNVQKIPNKGHKREKNEIPGTHLQEEWDRETSVML